MTVFGIDVAALLDAAGICVEIFFVDLLLSADNALVIALACRALPPDDVRRAAFIGTAGAIALRIAMAAVVLILLDIPFLRLVSAVALLVIAVQLTRGRPMADRATGRTHRNLAAAVGAIIVGDAVMSLDNVVAIATIARGSLVLLGIGLAMSIPMLIAGSAVIHRQLTADRLWVILGGMFLGWIAGQIAVSDPVVVGWVGDTAPALPLAVPAACAVFVLWEGRILDGR